MAKTSGGVRGGSRLKWNKTPGTDWYESQQLRYTGKGNEYGVVGRSDENTYWGVMGGVKGATGEVPARRREFKSEKALLTWMRKYGFVP